MCHKKISWITYAKNDLLHLKSYTIAIIICGRKVYLITTALFVYSYHGSITK